MTLLRAAPPYLAPPRPTRPTSPIPTPPRHGWCPSNEDISVGGVSPFKRLFPWEGHHSKDSYLS